MKSPFTIYLAAILVFFTASCGREREEYINGQIFAEQDLAKGELKVAIADYNDMPEIKEYTELLQNRYHIGWTSLTLPNNPNAAREWVRGYNEVVIPTIKLKFGTNILKQTLEDAKKLHDVKNNKP